jgi:hypothetical protein
LIDRSAAYLPFIWSTPSNGVRVKGVKDSVVVVGKKRSGAGIRTEISTLRLERECSSPAKSNAWQVHTLELFMTRWKIIKRERFDTTFPQ